MTKKRTSKAVVDRAAEYIDSGLMRQRLKHGRHLVVRIDGNYGVYTTRLRVGRRPEGQCTCPSDWSPCKHVRALEATWKLNPGSFLDLDDYLGRLATKSSGDLVKLIGRMAVAAPESLAACGFRDFEPERREDGEAAEQERPDGSIGAILTSDPATAHSGRALGSPH